MKLINDETNIYNVTQLMDSLKQNDKLIDFTADAIRNYNQKIRDKCQYILDKK